MYSVGTAGTRHSNATEQHSAPPCAQHAVLCALPPPLLRSLTRWLLTLFFYFLLFTLVLCSVFHVLRFPFLFLISDIAGLRRGGCGGARRPGPAAQHPRVAPPLDARLVGVVGKLSRRRRLLGSGRCRGGACEYQRIRARIAPPGLVFENANFFLKNIHFLLDFTLIFDFLSHFSTLFDVV